jgi:hypothetical protein
VAQNCRRRSAWSAGTALQHTLHPPTGPQFPSVCLLCTAPTRRHSEWSRTIAGCASRADAPELTCLQGDLRVQLAGGGETQHDGRLLDRDQRPRVRRDGLRAHAPRRPRHLHHGRAGESHGSRPALSTHGQHSACSQDALHYASDTTILPPQWSGEGVLAYAVSLSTSLGSQKTLALTPAGCCGRVQDGTDVFAAFHEGATWSKLKEFRVGSILEPEAKETPLIRVGGAVSQRCPSCES